MSSDAQIDLLCRGRVLYTLPDVFTEMCLSWIVIGSSCQGCNTYWPQRTNRPRPKLPEHPTISSSMVNHGKHTPETTTYLTQGGTSRSFSPLSPFHSPAGREKTTNSQGSTPHTHPLQPLVGYTFSHQETTTMGRPAQRVIRYLNNHTGKHHPSRVLHEVIFKFFLDFQYVRTVFLGDA